MAQLTNERILKEIETKLRSWLADGVTIENITGEVEAEKYLAKAAATTDPIMRAGYLELADEAMGPS